MFRRFAVGIALVSLLACTKANPLYCDADNAAAVCGAGSTCDLTLRRCVALADAAAGDRGDDGAATSDDASEDGDDDAPAGPEAGDDGDDAAPEPDADDAGGGEDAPVVADAPAEPPPPDAAGTCLAHADCTTGSKPVCAGGACSSCAAMPAGCAARDATKPACDVATGACVGCLSSGQCAAATAPICEAAAHACRKCSLAAECAARSPATPACTSAGFCVECNGSSDCAFDPTRPLCTVATNTCAKCASAGDCTAKSAGLRACLATGACVECDGSEDCTADASKPVCKANACSKCGGSADCAAASGGTLRGCLGTGACVGCTVNAECPDPAKGRCDGASQTCQPCQVDGDCATHGPPGVCLAGRCATEAEAIIVEEKTGCSDAGPGTLAVPYCNTQAAVDAMDAGDARRLLVLRGVVGPVKYVKTKPFAGTLTIVGQAGGQVTPSTVDTAGLWIDNVNMLVRDLTIANATFMGFSASGAPDSVTVLRVKAINNSGVGMHLQPAGALHVDRCTLENNGGGGMDIYGDPLDVTNNMIVNNGTGGLSGSIIGGASISGAQPGFRNNTIVGNKASTSGSVTSVSGLRCGSSAQGDAPRNLIVYGNTPFMRELYNCITRSSDIDTIGMPDGNGNVPGDPKLDANHHLTSSSPCRDMVAPADAAPADFDGEKRPKGAASDCGADEY